MRLPSGFHFNFDLHIYLLFVPLPLDLIMPVDFTTHRKIELENHNLSFVLFNGSSL